MVGIASPVACRDVVWLLIQVVAYIWAPEEEGQFQPGRASRWWLYHSLRALEQQVEARGSFICYRRGPCAVEQLLEICRDASASVVYFNNVYDPLSLIRDHEVKRQLSSAGIVSRNFNAELLFEPWAVLDDDGSPLTTFDEFWNRCDFCTSTISCVPTIVKLDRASSCLDALSRVVDTDICQRKILLDICLIVVLHSSWCRILLPIVLAVIYLPYLPYLGGKSRFCLHSYAFWHLHTVK